METLEDRVTPSTVMGDYVSLDNGILTICGTSGNDQVDVSKAAQQVKVEARLADGAITIEEFFSSSEVNRIVIQVYEGDDQVDLGKRILTHALIDAGAGNDQVQTGKGDSIIDGGAGNDKIQTGSGNDVLVGGAGDDDLSGGSGFNMMIGGLGSDSLFSDGTDILIGGSTSGTIVNVLVAHAVWIGTSGDETAVGGLLTVLDDGAVDEVLSADANDLDLGG